MLRIASSLLAAASLTSAASGAGVLDGIYQIPSTTPSAGSNSYRHLRFDSVAALDGDQRTVLARLAAESTASMAFARSVFELGAFSESYAQLTFEDDRFVMGSIPSNTPVSGVTLEGIAIEGVSFSGKAAGDNTLIVHYPATEAAGGSGNLCRVGGNPSPITTGCFSPTGTATLILPNPNPTPGLLDTDSGMAVYYDYSYDLLLHNSNALSLAKLQGDRKAPYQTTLQKYINFYGSPDYDNEWIRAGFEGRATPGFANDMQQATDSDFSKLDLEGRHAALKWGMVVLKVWIFVVESIEEAVSKCDGTMSASETSIDGWDRAVAAYTGSGPIASAPTNPDEGYFLYSLVETDCRDFGTCSTFSTVGTSMAPLNRDIFEAFSSGRDALMSGDCLAAGQHSKSISRKMTIPLVQGILRNAHALDLQEIQDGWVRGQVAAYASAILPLIHECSSGTAYTLLEDLIRRDIAGTSFEVVKDSLERTYTCLGITCEDVGGLLTVNKNGYEPGAGPCGKNSSGGGNGVTVSPAVSGVLSGPRFPNGTPVRDDGLDGQVINYKDGAYVVRWDDGTIEEFDSHYSEDMQKLGKLSDLSSSGNNNGMGASTSTSTGSPPWDPAYPNPGPSTGSSSNNKVADSKAIFQQEYQEQLIFGISIGAVVAAALAAVAYFLVDRKRSKRYETDTHGVDQEIARMQNATKDDGDDPVDETHILEMTSDAQIV